jgi:hypothetical protein
MTNSTKGGWGIYAVRYTAILLLRYNLHVILTTKTFAWPPFDVHNIVKKYDL